VKLIINFCRSAPTARGNIEEIGHFDDNVYVKQDIEVWFDSFYVRVSPKTAIYTVSHSTQSSPVVTHPSTNRGRRVVTSVNVPLRYSHPRKSIGQVKVEVNFEIYIADRKATTCI